jgi:hypothetical protein
MDYKSLLNNIKEDSITETLHLNGRVLLVDGMNTFLRSFAVISGSISKELDFKFKLFIIEVSIIL